MCDLVKKIKVQIRSIVPVVSGGASMWLMERIIFSNLPDWHYITALVSTVVLFIASVVLFAYLKKLEKDKDQHLLSTVCKIVEEVFGNYGVSMASNAAGPTTADQMNPIMQTIVNLVEKLRELADKTYTKD